MSMCARTGVLNAKMPSMMSKAGGADGAGGDDAGAEAAVEADDLSGTAGGVRDS